MEKRAWLAYMTAAVTLPLMIACGGPAPSAGGPDILFLSSPRGVAIVDSGATAPSYKGRDAVPSRDWSTVVQSVPRSKTTSIIAVDPSSGTERWTGAVSGYQRVKIVSETGDRVVAAPVNERYYKDGRATTSLTVTGSAALHPRHYQLDGNFEPEAFSTDGRSLFVISYLPARAPTSYQVRRLDLDTGRVVGVYTPDAQLQTAMGGTARVQVASPDGKRLYTLYTEEGGRYGEGQAFIHVLNLDELWAHCIELPRGFEKSSEATAALAVAPDGERLYVGNSSTGAVAQIDTERLQVANTMTADLGTGGGAQAIHDDGSRLYFASGISVASIDTEKMEQTGVWSMSGQVTGLQLANEADKLYVGQRDQVEVLDALSGRRMDSFDPPGVGRIKQLGPVLRSVERQRSSFVCAC